MKLISDYIINTFSCTSLNYIHDRLFYTTAAFNFITDKIDSKSSSYIGENTEKK